MNKYREIVKAAARIFKAKGYHAATVRDIANEVGMLKGSLYYHIESKEQLLLEVLSSALEVLRMGLTRVLSSGLSPPEKIRQAVTFHIRACLENEELAVFYSELGNLPEGLGEKIRAAVKEYQEIWHALLREGIAAGVFRGDLPSRIVLQAIFGMCNWTYLWFRQEGPLSPEEVGEIFAGILLEGIKS